MKIQLLKPFRQKKIIFALFLLVLCLRGATNVIAQDNLDPTFGTGGKLIPDLPGSRAQRVAVQPDGKIVVMGTQSGNSGNGDFFNLLARFNPNGTFDGSFGINGTVLIPYDDTSGGFMGGLAILPDGKILVSGNATVSNNFGPAVFRFNSDGSRDTSFGVNGIASSGYSSLNDSKTLAVQSGGKSIVVTNICDCGGNEPVWLGVGMQRFSVNGFVDTSFGNNGTLIIPSTASTAFYVQNAAVLPDDRLLLIGVAYEMNNEKIFLSRINANGTLDVSFGVNGILRLELNAYVSELAVQPDGKIVFPTHGGIGTFPPSIVRLNPDGTFDASFGNNGLVVIPSSEGNFFNSVLIHPTGKILAAGFLSNGLFRHRFAVIRLNPDGSRDATFGANGIVSTALASYYNFVVDTAIQPDGKLVAAGGVSTSSYDLTIGLARYLFDVPRAAKFDFDGDGRTDISVFRPADRTWYLNRSTAGFAAVQFGLPTDEIAPADFDGDGRADIAVFRDGIWYWLNSSTNSFSAIQFGLAGDIPQPADYTGDGRAELAVYRSGVWWIFDLSNNQAQALQFGLSADQPVASDYDGDGRADQAVYRSGEWHLNCSAQGYAVINFGLATDKPVIGDYDGDGKTDIAVYRDGSWHILQSQQGYTVFRFGLGTDLPAPADYDGDGKTDAAVFRDGIWYLLQSTNGVSIRQFGLSNDKPVPAAFLP